MRTSLALLLVCACATTALGDRRRKNELPSGFTATAGLGTNVDEPFLELQLGRRFKSASWFELYFDYSYNWPISEFSFQTFGIGTRTTFFRRERTQIFHQALLSFAVSSSGEGPVQDRALGERLLGAFVTQGLGIAVRLSPQWTMSLVAATGYPVWLRSELTVGVTF